MKNLKNTCTLLLILALLIPIASFSQADSDNKLKFEVNTIYPPLSITKEKLNKAQTISDLNKNYKPSWVREYKSVEITTSNQGVISKAVSKNDVLTQEQKDQMQITEVNTDISILVKYIPENSLQGNEIKEIDFSFKVNPENEAKFVEGEEQLKRYLKENAIDKIPVDCYNEFDLVAIKFTIDEDGKVMNTHVFETSNDKEIDQLLIATLNKMPNWKPAEYGNGIKVNQEFVLTIGNMKSCIINLLNINQD